MALVLKDRVKESTTTTGTGTLTLLGAATGYQAFSAIGDGNTCYYAISALGSADWEVGLGTYTASGTTLSRDTILSSSAAGAAVDFPAGVKDVYIVYPAEKAVFEQATGETILNNGPITVIGTNVTSFTSFGASLGEFYANQPTFAQLYVQNLNSDQNASTDIVAYSDIGDGTNNFIDMGICSSNYSEAAFPIFTPNVGYLYNDGGDLLVGSATDNVVIFAGGVNVNNTVLTFGTDLSATFEGAIVANSTLDVTGVAAFDTYAYSGANVASAANNTVLVTKAYVDDAVAAGVHFHEPVIYATAAVLPNSPTYNNGTAGVGATLTAGSNVALTIDGVTLTSPTDNGIRVLVQNQANAAHNGVYDVTEAGSGSAPWQLTRSADADTYVVSSPNGLSEGATFYVEAGTSNAGSTFTCNTQGVITFGTTAISFALVSSALTYTGGTNINVSGLTISLTGTVAATNGGTGQNTTAVGDLLYGTASNTWSKLALGAANKSLVVNGAGTQVEWNAVPLSAAGAVSGVLDETNGGTGNSSYTLGDTLYSSAANTLAKLSGNTTTTRKFLGQTGTGAVSAAPVWEQPAATDITGLAPSATTDTTNADNITSGTLNNARTTATASNGASTIIARDTNGSFAANLGSFVSVSGNGSAVTSLNASAIASGTVPTARLASGTANNTTFLRGDSTWAALSAPNNGTLTMNVSGVGLTGSASFTADQAGASTFTVASNATDANGGSTIVARDASGNFAGATITATTFSGSGASLTNIPNSATTAASANGASTIVARDASGNFSAGTITAALNGNANTATSATSATTATTATQVANALTAGTGLTSGGTFNGSAARTFEVSYGTTAGTACQGNDARLSDARQATNTNTQLASLGVGTAASGTAGEIRATNNITAFFSDERLKTKTGNIENALDKVCQIETMLYHANETAVALGYDASIQEVGVTAQSVQKVQPEIVVPAPIDDRYLTVRYEKLVPLLIEAIKELKAQVAELKAK